MSLTSSKSYLKISPEICPQHLSLIIHRQTDKRTDKPSRSQYLLCSEITVINYDLKEQDHIDAAPYPQVVRQCAKAAIMHPTGETAPNRTARNSDPRHDKSVSLRTDLLAAKQSSVNRVRRGDHCRTTNIWTCPRQAPEYVSSGSA